MDRFQWENGPDDGAWKNPMKRCRTIGALALIAVFLGACLPISTNPLSDPKTAAVDDRLVGRWSATKEGQTKEKQTPIVDFVRQEEGMTDVLIVESHGKKAADVDLGNGVVTHFSGRKGKWSAFRMFPSRIAGHAFMNLRLIAPEESQGDFRGGYLLARYEITEKDKLKVWLLDSRKAEAAIKSGLAGDVKEEAYWSEVTIAASTEEWVSYFQTIDPVRLFSMEFATFQRIK